MLTSAAIAAAVASSLLLLLLWPALPVQAQSEEADTTITVNTEEDELNTDGDCSLREAVEAANTNAAVDGCPAGSASGEDRIVFELGKNATITLELESGGQLTVTDPAGLTIDCGKKGVTVSGGGGGS